MKSNQPSIKDQVWYHDPFTWYKNAENPPMYGIQLGKNVALDFMVGLCDMYEAFERNDRKQAMHDARVLAVLLIASALEYGEEAVQELLSEEMESIDIDDAFAKLLEEESSE
jgi:hypothetical protein